MSITALTGLAPEWYTPEQEGDDKTKFYLKPLTGIEYAQVLATGDIKDGYIGLSAESTALCIKYGLIGWENFKGADGKPIEFSSALISSIPGSYLYPIAHKVFTMSMLAEIDKKKS